MFDFLTKCITKGHVVFDGAGLWPRGALGAREHKKTKESPFVSPVPENYKFALIPFSNIILFVLYIN